MNEGVQIILERMKTNPEEFVPEYQHGTTKWGNIITQYNEYLTTEESEAINKAYKDTVHKVMRERFTSKVMEELIDPKPEPYQTSAYTLNATAGTNTPTWATNTGQVTLPNGSITLGKTTLEESKLQELLLMKREVEAQKMELAAQKERSKAITIFGKLFNYS
jgi:hypothetical protein